MPWENKISSRPTRTNMTPFNPGGCAFVRENRSTCPKWAGSFVNKVERMKHANAHIVLRKLDQLRTELVDLAFSLEKRGRRDAADIAIAVSSRVGELCEEITGSHARPAATATGSPSSKNERANNRSG